MSVRAGSTSCSYYVLIDVWQDGNRGDQIQMTAFQSMQQGAHSLNHPVRGSWDFDSPMAAAVSASMAGKSAPILTVLDQIPHAINVENQYLVPLFRQGVH